MFVLYAQRRDQPRVSFCHGMVLRRFLEPRPARPRALVTGGHSRLGGGTFAPAADNCFDLWAKRGQDTASQVPAGGGGGRSPLFMAGIGMYVWYSCLFCVLTCNAYIACIDMY